MHRLRCSAAFISIVCLAGVANASSVDVIWSDSGTASTTAPIGASVMARIVVSVGPGDTPLIGSATTVILSSDSTGGAILVGTSQTAVDTGWMLHGLPVPTNPHTPLIIAQADHWATDDPGVPAGGSATIGYLVVQVGSTDGTILISPSDPEFDRIETDGDSDVIDEFTFNPGLVFLPEPDALSMLLAGGFALAQMGRRLVNAA